MKTNLILKLYDSLINGEVVSREKFCRKYAISARTFYRYIDDVRGFLQSEHPDSPLAKTGIDNCYYIKVASKPGAKKSALPRRLEPDSAAAESVDLAEVASTCSDTVEPVEPDTSEPDLFVKVEPVKVAEVEVAEPADRNAAEPAAFESVLGSVS